MTSCSVYIGDPDDPDFHVSGKDRACNVPRALSKTFPPVRQHYHALFRAWANARDIALRQTDYDCHVAKVRKGPLLDYLDYAYGADPSYNDPESMLYWEGRPYLVDQLVAIHTFVAALDEDSDYLLVAMSI